MHGSYGGAQRAKPLRTFARCANLSIDLTFRTVPTTNECCGAVSQSVVMDVVVTNLSEFIREQRKKHKYVASAFMSRGHIITSFCYYA